MRRDFVSMAPDEKLLEAERIMRLGRIRHLPIVDDGELVGILSHRDLADAALSSAAEASPSERIEHLRRIPISKVMQRTLHVVEASTTLREAAVQMLRYKIGCLPVVEKDGESRRMIGLVTESDLLEAAYLPTPEE
jgi:CBS domain-containing protein